MEKCIRMICGNPDATFDLEKKGLQRFKLLAYINARAQLPKTSSMVVPTSEDSETDIPIVWTKERVWGGMTPTQRTLVTRVMEVPYTHP